MNQYHHNRSEAWNPREIPPDPEVYRVERLLSTFVLGAVTGAVAVLLLWGAL